MVLASHHLQDVRSALADYRPKVIAANQPAATDDDFDALHSSREHLIQVILDATGNQPVPKRLNELDPYPVGCVFVDDKVCLVSYDSHEAQWTIQVTPPIVPRSV
jgi:hypothetical protein